MNEETRVLPKAKIEKSRSSWLLWLIPTAAALLCVWYLCRDLIFAGPTITIYFQNADGLQDQVSLVQYRGVKVGEVESLKLTKDRQSVAVKAQLDSSAANLAREGSVFWIVRPEVKLGAVSGLRTIVMGNYITVQPGNGARTNLFTGAETAPIEPIKALAIELHSVKLDALQPQSPISYRGIQVGEVLDCRLSEDAREVVVHARISEEYAPLVRINSKFWNAGGINFHLGLFSGAKISAESAQTLVSGGIAFATPPDFQGAVTNGAVFILNEKSDPAWEKWTPTIPLHFEPEPTTNKTAWPNLNPQ
ncbi:MAG TPA: MlaD family protein [Verrucomicrobiae bacterium]|jgi:paraquat-inducible protein B|nr:MlaD family protein [Verrucomicrobiae bacterium]